MTLPSRGLERWLTLRGVTKRATGAAILYLTSWGRHLGSHVVGTAILDLTSWRQMWYTGAYTTRRDENWAAMKSKCWNCFCLNCEVSNVQSLLDRSVHRGYGCFGVYFRSLLVRGVYRQRMYFYLVQFSCILHCWLQRYHARIRTLGSSHVYICWETNTLIRQPVLWHLIWVCTVCLCQHKN